MIQPEWMAPFKQPEKLPKVRKKRSYHSSGYTHKSVLKAQSHMLKFLNMWLNLFGNDRQARDEIYLDADYRCRRYRHADLHQGINDSGVNFNKYHGDEHFKTDSTLSPDFMTICSALEIPCQEAQEVLFEAEDMLVFNYEAKQAMSAPAGTAVDLECTRDQFKRKKGRFEDEIKW